MRIGGRRDLRVARASLVLAGLTIASGPAAARRGPRLLRGEVHYDYIDQNGVGWVTSSGQATIELTLGAKPTLTVRSTSRVADGQLVAGASPGGTPGMKVQQWDGDDTATFPLVDVAHQRGVITFALTAGHDQLTGRCAPVRLPELPRRRTLYACTVEGFAWHAVPSLPALRHEFVLDSAPSIRRPIRNLMSGKTRPQFGQRKVEEAPAPPRR